MEQEGAQHTAPHAAPHAGAQRAAYHAGAAPSVSSHQPSLSGTSPIARAQRTTDALSSFACDADVDESWEARSVWLHSTRKVPQVCTGPARGRGEAAPRAVGCPGYSTVMQPEWLQHKQHLPNSQCCCAASTTNKWDGMDGASYKVHRGSISLRIPLLGLLICYTSSWGSSGALPQAAVTTLSCAAVPHVRSHSLQQCSTSTPYPECRLQLSGDSCQHRSNIFLFASLS